MNSSVPCAPRWHNLFVVPSRKRFQRQYRCRTQRHPPPSLKQRWMQGWTMAGLGQLGMESLCAKQPRKLNPPLHTHAFTHEDNIASRSPLICTGATRLQSSRTNSPVSIPLIGTTNPKPMINSSGGEEIWSAMELVTPAYLPAPHTESKCLLENFLFHHTKFFKPSPQTPTQIAAFLLAARGCRTRAIPSQGKEASHPRRLAPCITTPCTALGRTSPGVGGVRSTRRHPSTCSSICTQRSTTNRSSISRGACTRRIRTGRGRLCI